MTGYASNVFLAAVSFKMVPAMLRPMVAVFSPFLYRIHFHRRAIRRILRSAIEQRLAWKRDKPDFWKSRLRSEQPCSMDWLVDKSPPEKANPWDIAHGLIGIGFGASHTTSSHVVNCMLQLAADFEHLAPALRAEIESVLGSDRKNINNADLSKMWKLDSFMKECQRFHPPS